MADNLTLTGLYLYESGKTPSNIKILSLDSNRLYLSWSAPSSTNVTGYKVHIAYTNDSNFTELATTTGLNYTVNGLEADRDYYFTLKTLYSGTNGPGNSGWEPNLTYIPTGVRTVLETGVSPYNISVMWDPIVTGSTQVLTTGFVSQTAAYYGFNGNYNDSSSNGFNLVQTGTNTVQFSSQKVEGTNSYGPRDVIVRFPSGLISYMDTLNPVTLDFYVMPTGNTASSRVFEFYSGVDTKTSANTFSNRLTWGTPGNSLNTTVSSVPLNAWTKVTLVASGATKSIFINDIFNVSSSFNGSISGLGVTTGYIGFSQFNANYRGLIDRFVIYSGVITGINQNGPIVTGTAFLGLSGFRVWRSDGWDKEMSSIGSTTDTFYIDSGNLLDITKSYYYRVTSLS